MRRLALLVAGFVLGLPAAAHAGPFDAPMAPALAGTDRIGPHTSTAPPGTGEVFRVIADQTGVARSVRLYLDELRIYDRALSAAEIRADLAKPTS